MTHAGALDVTEFVERGEAALDAAHAHAHAHATCYMHMHMHMHMHLRHRDAATRTRPRPALDETQRTTPTRSSTRQCNETR